MDPVTRGSRHDGRAVREEKRAAGKYYQESCQKKCVVYQCCQSAPEPGTGCAGHGLGAAAGFFALGGGELPCDFAPGAAGLALGTGFGTNSCSKGLNIWS